MPLYVIRPPNPAAGFDWSYAVPGQYLEDIVSVTATLTTQPAGAVTAADSSSNGFDGTYHGGDNTGWFQPGLVAGDLCFLTGQLLAGPKWWFTTPYAAIQQTGWSFACWIALDPAAGAAYDQVYLWAQDAGLTNVVEIETLPGSGGVLHVASPAFVGDTAADVIPTSGAKAFICVTWDGATMTAYKDGAPIAWAATTPLVPGAVTFLPPQAAKSNLAGARCTSYLDEWTVWAGAISAGDVAAMYAAASVSFTAYSAAVIATAPAIYYHLDDGALGESRTPAMAITDGTYTVGEFPSGFPAAGNSGAYQYTWSARQAANSQTANGLTTSISLPPLVLPAGYTIGTFTPGLGGLDQWSDINIWWDSSLMDDRNGLNDYKFAPGWKLDYHYDPAAP